jgi:hypothetical protein
VIATGSFAGRQEVLVLLASAGLIGMGLIMPVAAQMGARKPKDLDNVSGPGEAGDRSGVKTFPVPATGESRFTDRDDNHPTK